MTLLTRALDRWQSLRLSRGNKGSLFVLVPESEPDDAELESYLAPPPPPSQPVEPSELTRDPVVVRCIHERPCDILGHARGRCSFLPSQVAARLRMAIGSCPRRCCGQRSSEGCARAAVRTEAAHRGYTLRLPTVAVHRGCPPGLQTKGAHREDAHCDAEHCVCCA